jgi:hypothetical protein
VLARLELLLREQGGLMASLLRPAATPADGTPAAGPPPAGPPAAARAAANGAGLAQLVVAGPRVRERSEEYELLVEAIYEGYLLHYGEPRVLSVPEADLALLAGDRLYAIGLARLVALGDIFAVAELADTITLSALAQGSGESELAEAVWVAGARAVGWGASASHQAAKGLVLAGSAEALEAMRTSATTVPTPH